MQTHQFEGTISPPYLFFPLLLSKLLFLREATSALHNNILHDHFLEDLVSGTAYHLPSINGFFGFYSKFITAYLHVKYCLPFSPLMNGKKTKMAGHSAKTEKGGRFVYCFPITFNILEFSPH